MQNKVKDYISQSLKEESEIWLGIAKEKTKQYPQESMRQIIVRTIIQHFEQKYPSLMEEMDDEVKKKRELSKNEYAVDKDTDIRRDAAIPDGLMTRINKAFQQHGWYRFLSNEAQKEYKELDWFIKEFPRYTIPDQY